MLKIVLLALALFWVARVIGRYLPRFQINIDEQSSEDVRVYSVMREHFPNRYEAYRGGLLSETEERRLFLDCIEILGVREEIERL